MRCGGRRSFRLPLPTSLRGSFIIGEVAIAKYRLLSMLVGLVVFAGIQLVLNRTKIGLLIRAGVETARWWKRSAIASGGCSWACSWSGSGLAGLGGVMWALYREQVHASMGNDLTVLVFIVVIIGGLGSIGGCFHRRAAGRDGRELRRLSGAKLALVSNILLMVAILMWRPRGLYAVTSR